MARAVARAVLDPAQVEVWLLPRRELVAERADGERSFVANEGPVSHYRRYVETEVLADGRIALTSITEFRLAVPYFGWLFFFPAKAVFKRPPRPDGGDRQPWWAPPDRLDARASRILGVLAAASLVAGYLGTLITQTITFAADGLEVEGTSSQGYALAIVRVGILIALVMVSMADRIGRRRMLLVAAGGGCSFAVLGAAAPSLAWLTATQVVSRSCSAALVILIGIMAAEEMPRGSRAYAVSILGLAAALGAGLCVMALPLTDLGLQAWRLVYLVPLLALPLVASVARRLPESRRFGSPHHDVPLAGHGRRLALLAASTFLVSIFTSPASQFQNEFLRENRGFSASRISLFTILTNTPGGIGVVVGGKLADMRGRRVVGAVGLIGGVGATVLMYQSAGWTIWGWSVVGAVIGAATIPALGVYGPELFPTSLRGRANGLIAVVGVSGSALGLLAGGLLSDRLDGLPTALALLSIGPAVVAVLVLTLYPETAHRELEELNPEDLLKSEPEVRP